MTANLLVLAGGYDSLPRRSALHRQTSGGSSAAGSSCVGSCAKVLEECEKKVKLLEEILRLQDEALQAGRLQKTSAAAAASVSSAASSPPAHLDLPASKSAAGVSVPWLFPTFLYEKMFSFNTLINWNEKEVLKNIACLAKKIVLHDDKREI